MNARSLLLPLVLASALGAVPAQEFHATLLLRGFRGEIDIDASLLNVLLGETACLEAIAESCPTGKDWSSVSAGVDTPRAGTQRVELSIVRTGGNAGTDAATRKAVLDAAVRHLHSRLDALFFDGRMRQLTKQREELSTRHREMLVEHAVLRARIDAADANRRLAEQRRNDTLQRLASVRLDLAVEERAHQQLDVLRGENAEARSACNVRLSELAQKKAQVDAQMQQLQMAAQMAQKSAGPDKAEVARLGAEIGKTTTEVAMLGLAIDDATAKAADVQRMLTIVLEQLPTSRMALLRATMLADVLEAQARRSTEELDAADKRAREAADLEARAEQLAIDITVTKTLLQEVQDQLARLQPLQLDVLYRQD